MNLTSLNELVMPWAEGMFRACWQGALAVGMVWCLCRLSPCLPAATRALLWWLVCLKALLSLVTTGPLKLAVLPAAPVPSAATAVLTPVAVQAVSVKALPPFTSISPSSSIRQAPSVPLPRPSLSSILFALWLTGVLALLALVGLERRAVRRLAAQARPCDAVTPLREIARALGLAASPPLLVSERANSSLVMGLWRPKVVLCQADLLRLTQSELGAVLAHELAHIRRRDLLAGMLPNLARLVFFFDPFVWLACREYDLAREAACDAEALRVSGMAPADYGRLLLKLSLPSPPLTPTAGIVTLGVASPDSLLLRRRLEGLRRSGGLPRGGASLVLLVTLGALSLHPIRGSARPAAARHEVPVAKPLAPPAIVSAGLPAVTLPNLVFTKGTDTMFTRFMEQKPLTRPIGQKPKLSAALATASLALVSAPALLAPAPTAAQTPPPAPAVPAEPATSTAPVVPVVQAGRYQYTLRMGSSYSTHTQERRVASAQRELAKAQPGDCLVVDRDGKRYLITDPETLRKLQDNDAPMEELGKQMEAKGKEMELSSKPMEALGKQMEAFGKQMEGKGQELEALGKQLEGASETERQSILEKMQARQQEMKAPAEEMRQLGKKMREHGDKMRGPGNEMRELGQKMRVAAKEANERMVTLLDTAFKNNLAVEQKGS
ncbi:M56 family metallopeptidase [Armatimonas rosea]|uniref:Beta-lactamase regulating signal transducer with metallopeptidase domain n=1 Tax=Armatimonas rosea TaxID=685828 RepID=A0A7W9SNZ3_ARMRO|nr:M56 family metallopeptidase [Armatimonas rosea]MBB6050106.1 beta-lactamase regulating signal transducer with metallopeptidase domain [Armatimonas rosea]